MYKIIGRCISYVLSFLLVIQPVSFAMGGGRGALYPRSSFHDPNFVENVYAASKLPPGTISSAMKGTFRPIDGSMRSINETERRELMNRFKLAKVRVYTIQYSEYGAVREMTVKAKILSSRDSDLPDGIHCLSIGTGKDEDGKEYMMLVIDKPSMGMPKQRMPYLDEILYHEWRELHWIREGLSQSDAHILASAEEALAFMRRRQVTPYHEYRLQNLSLDELNYICDEKRGNRYDDLYDRLGPIKKKMVLNYEETFRGIARICRNIRKALGRVKGMPERRRNSILYTLGRMGEREKRKVFAKVARAESSRIRNEDELMLALESWVTIEQLGKIMGMTTAGINKIVKSGIIKSYVKIGRSYYFYPFYAAYEYFIYERNDKGRRIFTAKIRGILKNMSMDELTELGNNVCRMEGAPVLPIGVTRAKLVNIIMEHLEKWESSANMAERFGVTRTAIEPLIKRGYIKSYIRVGGQLLLCPARAGMEYIKYIEDYQQDAAESKRKRSLIEGLNSHQKKMLIKFIEEYFGVHPADDELPGIIEKLPSFMSLSEELGCNRQTITRLVKETGGYIIFNRFGYQFSLISPNTAEEIKRKVREYLKTISDWYQETFGEIIEVNSFYDLDAWMTLGSLQEIFPFFPSDMTKRTYVKMVKIGGGFVASQYRVPPIEVERLKKEVTDCIAKGNNFKVVQKYRLIPEGITKESLDFETARAVVMSVRERWKSVKDYSRITGTNVKAIYEKIWSGKLDYIQLMDDFPGMAGRIYLPPFPSKELRRIQQSEILKVVKFLKERCGVIIPNDGNVSLERIKGLLKRYAITVDEVCRRIGISRIPRIEELDPEGIRIRVSFLGDGPSVSYIPRNLGEDFIRKEDAKVKALVKEIRGIEPSADIRTRGDIISYLKGQWISLKQVSEQTGVSQDTVRRMAFRAKEIPYVRMDLIAEIKKMWIPKRVVDYIRDKLNNSAKLVAEYFGRIGINVKDNISFEEVRELLSEYCMDRTDLYKRMEVHSIQDVMSRFDCLNIRFLGEKNLRCYLPRSEAEKLIQAENQKFLRIKEKAEKYDVDVRDIKTKRNLVSYLNRYWFSVKEFADYAGVEEYVVRNWNAAKKLPFLLVDMAGFPKRVYIPPDSAFSIPPAMKGTFRPIDGSMRSISEAKRMELMKRFKSAKVRGYTIKYSEYGAVREMTVEAKILSANNGDLPEGIHCLCIGTGKDENGKEYMRLVIDRPSTGVDKAKSPYLNEILFHEYRELQWIKDGLPASDAHILASAEEALAFMRRRQVTPYHEYRLQNLSISELRAVIREDRGKHYEDLYGRLGPIKKKMMLKYEETFRGVARVCYNVRKAGIRVRGMPKKRLGVISGTISRMGDKERKAVMRAVSRIVSCRIWDEDDLMSELESWLTVEQLADMVGMTTAGINRVVKRGGIKSYVKIGRSRYFHPFYAAYEYSLYARNDKGRKTFLAKIMKILKGMTTGELRQLGNDVCRMDGGQDLPSTMNNTGLVNTIMKHLEEWETVGNMAERFGVTRTAIEPLVKRGYIKSYIWVGMKLLLCPARAGAEYVKYIEEDQQVAVEGRRKRSLVEGISGSEKKRLMKFVKEQSDGWKTIGDDEIYSLIETLPTSLSLSQEFGISTYVIGKLLKEIGGYIILETENGCQFSLIFPKTAEEIKRRVRGYLKTVSGWYKDSFGEMIEINSFHDLDSWITLALLQEIFPFFPSNMTKNSYVKKIKIEGGFVVPQYRVPPVEVERLKKEVTDCIADGRNFETAQKYGLIPEGITKEKLDFETALAVITAVKNNWKSADQYSIIARTTVDTIYAKIRSGELPCIELLDGLSGIGGRMYLPPLPFKELRYAQQEDVAKVIKFLEGECGVSVSNKEEVSVYRVKRLLKRYAITGREIYNRLGISGSPRRNVLDPDNTGIYVSFWGIPGSVYYMPRKVGEEFIRKEEEKLRRLIEEIKNIDPSANITTREDVIRYLEKQWYSIEDTAGQAGISVNTVRRMVLSTKEIPYVRMTLFSETKKVWVPKSAVDYIRRKIKDVANEVAVWLEQSGANVSKERGIDGVRELLDEYCMDVKGFSKCMGIGYVKRVDKIFPNALKIKFPGEKSYRYYILRSDAEKFMQEDDQKFRETKENAGEYDSALREVTTKKDLVDYLNKNWFSIRGFAYAAGVKEECVRGWIRNNKIPYIKVNMAGFRKMICIPPYVVQNSRFNKAEENYNMVLLFLPLFTLNMNVYLSVISGLVLLAVVVNEAETDRAIDAVKRWILPVCRYVLLAATGAILALFLARPQIIADIFGPQIKTETLQAEAEYIRPDAVLSVDMSAVIPNMVDDPKTADQENLSFDELEGDIGQNASAIHRIFTEMGIEIEKNELVYILTSLLWQESRFRQFDRPGHVLRSSKNAVGISQVSDGDNGVLRELAYLLRCAIRNVCANPNAVMEITSSKDTSEYNFIRTREVVKAGDYGLNIIKFMNEVLFDGGLSEDITQWQNEVKMWMKEKRGLRQKLRDLEEEIYQRMQKEFDIENSAKDNLKVGCTYFALLIYRIAYIRDENGMILLERNPDFPLIEAGLWAYNAGYPAVRRQIGNNDEMQFADKAVNERVIAPINWFYSLLLGSGVPQIGKGDTVERIIFNDKEMPVKFKVKNYGRLIALEKVGLDIAEEIRRIGGGSANCRNVLDAVISQIGELQIYKFSKLRGDMMGFAYCRNNRNLDFIALYEKILSKPIALFHEVCEYLIVSGAMGILANDGVLVVDIEGQEYRINLTRQDALAILRKGSANPHYLLRTLQRELFGDMDRELTWYIKALARKNLDRSKGIIKEWAEIVQRGAQPSARLIEDANRFEGVYFLKSEGQRMLSLMPIKDNILSFWVKRLKDGVYKLRFVYHKGYGLVAVLVREDGMLYLYDISDYLNSAVYYEGTGKGAIYGKFIDIGGQSLTENDIGTSDFCATLEQVYRKKEFLDILKKYVRCKGRGVRIPAELVSKIERFKPFRDTGHNFDDYFIILPNIFFCLERKRATESEYDLGLRLGRNGNLYIYRVVDERVFVYALDKYIYLYKHKQYKQKKESYVSGIKLPGESLINSPEEILPAIDAVIEDAENSCVIETTVRTPEFNRICREYIFARIEGRKIDRKFLDLVENFKPLPFVLMTKAEKSFAPIIDTKGKKVSPRFIVYLPKVKKNSLQYIDFLYNSGAIWLRVRDGKDGTGYLYSLERYVDTIRKGENEWVYLERIYRESRTPVKYKKGLQYISNPVDREALRALRIIGRTGYTTIWDYLVSFQERMVPVSCEGLEEMKGLEEKLKDLLARTTQEEVKGMIEVEMDRIGMFVQNPPLFKYIKLGRYGEVYLRKGVKLKFIAGARSEPFKFNGGQWNLPSGQSAIGEVLEDVPLWRMTRDIVLSLNGDILRMKLFQLFRQYRNNIRIQAGMTEIEPAVLGRLFISERIMQEDTYRIEISSLPGIESLSKKITEWVESGGIVRHGEKRGPKVNLRSIIPIGLRKSSGLIILEDVDIKKLVLWLNEMKRYGMDLDGIKIGVLSPVRDTGIIGAGSVYFGKTINSIIARAEEDNVVYIGGFGDGKIEELKRQGIKLIKSDGAGLPVEVTVGIALLGIEGYYNAQYEPSEDVKMFYGRYLEMLYSQHRIDRETWQSLLTELELSGYIILPKMPKVLRLWKEILTSESQIIQSA